MTALEFIGALFAALVVISLICLIHGLIHAFTCNECPYKDYCERHENDKDFSPCEEQNLMRNDRYASNGFSI